MTSPASWRAASVKDWSPAGRNGSDDHLEHGRGAASPAPAKFSAGARDGQVLGITRSPTTIQARFNDLAHWGYGTAWGSRAACSTPGLPPRGDGRSRSRRMGQRAADAPRLDVAPPAIFWPPREIAIDAFHHAVYAVATGITYELLSTTKR